MPTREAPFNHYKTQVEAVTAGAQHTLTLLHSPCPTLPHTQYLQANELPTVLATLPLHLPAVSPVLSQFWDVPQCTVG